MYTADNLNKEKNVVKNLDSSFKGRRPHKELTKQGSQMNAAIPRPCFLASTKMASTFSAHLAAIH